MIIEYDTEDRCIRVDDVAVNHEEAARYFPAIRPRM